MKAHLHGSHRNRWLVPRATVLAVVFYFFTIGLVSAVFRHVEDGRLQWLRSVPGALAALGFYEWPARCAGRLPVVRELIELSAEVWCGITDAPETTA